MVPRIRTSTGRAINCHGLYVVYASVSSLNNCATTGPDPTRYGRTLTASARARKTAKRSEESSTYPRDPVPSVKDTICVIDQVRRIVAHGGTAGPTVEVGVYKPLVVRPRSSLASVNRLRLKPWAAENTMSFPVVLRYLVFST